MKAAHPIKSWWRKELPAVRAEMPRLQPFSLGISSVGEVLIGIGVWSR